MRPGLGAGRGGDVGFLRGPPSRLVVFLGAVSVVEPVSVAPFEGDSWRARSSARRDAVARRELGWAGVGEGQLGAGDSPGAGSAEGGRCFVG